MYPNIVGAFNAIYRGYSGTHTASGAVKFNTVYSAKLRGTDSGDDWGATYNVNATLSNATYGKSTTVQPNSTRTYFLIRF